MQLICVVLIFSIFGKCFTFPSVNTTNSIFRFRNITTTSRFRNITTTSTTATYNISREPRCQVYSKFGQVWCISTNQVSYFEAMFYCHQNNMTLLSMESTKKWGLFTGILLSYSLPVRNYTFHTSGMSLPNKGWSWIDSGKPASIGIYYQDDYDCLGVLFNPEERSSTYIIVNCTARHSFVCERISTDDSATNNYSNATDVDWYQQKTTSYDESTTEESFEIKDKNRQGRIDILIKLLIKPKVSIKTNVEPLSVNISK